VKNVEIESIEGDRINGGFHGMHFLMEQRSLRVERKIKIGKSVSGYSL
jgi:hypothetical protein